MISRAEIEFLFGLAIFPTLIFAFASFCLSIISVFSAQHRHWSDGLFKMLLKIFIWYFFMIFLPSLAIIILAILNYDGDGSFKAKMAYDTKLPVTFFDNVAANSFVLNLIAYLWLGVGCLLTMALLTIKVIKKSQQEIN